VSKRSFEFQVSSLQSLQSQAETVTRVLEPLSDFSIFRATATFSDQPVGARSEEPNAEATEVEIVETSTWKHRNLALCGNPVPKTASSPSLLGIQPIVFPS